MEKEVKQLYENICYKILLDTFFFNFLVFKFFLDFYRPFCIKKKLIWALAWIYIFRDRVRFLVATAIVEQILATASGMFWCL